jgi:hypothetical protein
LVNLNEFCIHWLSEKKNSTKYQYKIVQNATTKLQIFSKLFLMVILDFPSTLFCSPIFSTS